MLFGWSTNDYVNGTPAANNTPIHLYTLNLDSLTWRKLEAQGRAPGNVISHASCLHTANGIMYVYTSFARTNHVGELYVMNYQRDIPVWSVVRTTGRRPVELTESCMNMTPNGRLLLFGGDFELRASDHLFEYDTLTAVWNKGRKKSSRQQQNEFHVRGKARSRRCHTSVCAGDKLWYIGGGDDDFIPLSEVLMLDLK